MRRICLATSVALTVSVAPGLAQERPVKIGVLTDMSSVYADASGQGSVEAAKLAVEDAGLVLGQQVQIVFADHQMKPDVGANVARRWFEREDVDAIVDVPNSGVAFALRNLSIEQKKILLLTGSLSADLTGSQCSPYLTQWAVDTYTQSKVLASAIVKNGGDSWFFVGANYTFGQALVRDASTQVEASGGKVVGSVYAPLGASDFSSFLLQAQSSKAKVIGLANSAGDTANAIKQANEFGLVKGGQRLAGLMMFDLDVKSVGLKLAEGLQLSSPFYWDLDNDTREWTKRYMQRVNRIPSWNQAAVYTSVVHYLKGIKAANTKNSDRVLEKMRAIPISDAVTKDAMLRMDGKVERPHYLLEAKGPTESKGEWDLLKVVTKIPAGQATRPLNAGGCALVSSNSQSK